MAALNQTETNNLSLAERAMNDAANRLARVAESPISYVTHDGPSKQQVVMDLDEVEFMIKSLRQAKGLVSTVKQMKGYYPK